MVPSSLAYLCSESESLALSLSQLATLAVYSSA
jgi:hypothetical protein